MKCKNKSLLSQRWEAVQVVLFCVVFVFLSTLTTSGFAQSYSKNSAYQSSYQNFLGGPYSSQPYQFIPSLSSAGGPSLIGGGRVVEAVKAHPLHYSSFVGGAPYQHHTASPPPYISPSPSQSSSPYYPGYYYVGDKEPHQSPKTRPSYSVPSSIYSSPYHQSSIPSTVTVSSPPPSYSFGRPSSQPPTSYPSYSTPSRFPSGPVTSASMDTYREALDLFTEVVRTLGKETVQGFGPYSYPPSNGIYGSSSTPGPSGFPHHLDHIMGPEFLQRAHKLYNKIIKEQNYNRGIPEQSPPPSYYTTSSASRGHPLNGLSYLESTIQPGPKKRARSRRPYTYTSSSPYSRNMVVDRVTPDSPLERSLIDTVRALEVNVDKPSEIPHEQSDEMETSESRFVPQQFNYEPQPTDNYVQNQYPQVPPSTVPPPPQPSQPPTPEIPSTQPPPPQLETIPLNENDFIEHPLAYNEYEELIREIAINHNY